MNRKICVFLLSTMVAFQLGTAIDVYAAEKQVNNTVIGVKSFPQRRLVIDNNKQAEELSLSYGVSKVEVLKLLNDGHSYRELQTALLYAELTKKSVKDVLEMHRTATWGRVRILLGMNAEIYAKKMQERQISKMVAANVLKEYKARSYIQQGYPLNDIKMACEIAKEANKIIDEILPLRTVVNDWHIVRQNLGLKVDNIKTGLSGKNSQRHGAGFAGLRVRAVDKNRLLQILNRDYLFSIEELSPLYDELGFTELEDVCLHAYLGQVPLSEIMQMRQLYSWDRIKYMLGLRPEVYFYRCVDYQARRLNERMHIPLEFTIRNMHEGYAMHHINSAWLMAEQCNTSADKIIIMKTPYNTWNDVAVALGITAEECQKIKDKISLEFGRHN